MTWPSKVYQRVRSLWKYGLMLTALTLGAEAGLTFAATHSGQLIPLTNPLECCGFFYPMHSKTWMGPFSGMGLLWMIVFWAVIVTLLIMLFKRLVDSPSKKGKSGMNQSPKEILKERYAKGEIDKEEYLTKLEDVS